MGRFDSGERTGFCPIVKSELEAGIGHEVVSGKRRDRGEQAKGRQYFRLQMPRPWFDVNKQEMT